MEVKVGAWRYLKGLQDIPSEVSFVDRHLHVAVELSHSLLTHLSPILLHILL